jgi:hypothetical protein
LADARNREFDQAMSLIIDELKVCQKSLRGNILMQLIEKILSVQKENALNYSRVEEAAAQKLPLKDLGLVKVSYELMTVFKALLKQTQALMKKKNASGGQDTDRSQMSTARKQFLPHDYDERQH